MLSWWQNLPSILDPVMFSLGPIEVRYYGLMYLVAFAVVYCLVLYRLKAENRFNNVKLTEVQDFFLYAFLAVVVGGRLGYILFYDLAYYWANPLQIIIPFDLDTGQFTGIAGMSFHGGLIGIILATWLFCKKFKISFWELCDLIVPAVPLGYFFGRVGNFLNNELWGRETDFMLGMKVNLAENFLRHPSQLYEAFFEGLILFAILWFTRRISLLKGMSLSIFLIGYGFFRFFIEYVREPDAHLGFLWLNLTMGQLLCLGMILTGVILGLFVKRMD